MDLVAFNDEEEWNKVHQYTMETIFKRGENMAPKANIDGQISIWTSGRLCDFDGCEKAESLKPIHVKGWFWSADNSQMSPTNCVNGAKNCWHE